MATSHLASIIAVEKDVKDKASQQLTSAQSILSQTNLLTGIARTYTPKDDEGEQLPPESTRVRFKAKQVLKDIENSLVALFNVVATKDYTNCVARASVTVDTTVLLTDVPTTYLLFLEKQLAEMLTFIKKIPTLDASETWTYDTAQDCWATSPVETLRSKKVLRNHVKAEATPHHPAQVEMYTEDVTAGRWKTIKYSGAMLVSDLNAMIERVEKLQRAVKFAREEANRHEALQQHVGETLLQYIFG